MRPILDAFGGCPEAGKFRLPCWTRVSSRYTVVQGSIAGAGPEPTPVFVVQAAFIISLLPDSDILRSELDNRLIKRRLSQPYPARRRIAVAHRPTSLSRRRRPPLAALKALALSIVPAQTMAAGFVSTEDALSHSRWALSPRASGRPSSRDI